MINSLKTFLFLTILTLLFMWIGGLIGGRVGMMYGLLFAMGANFVSYYFSDKIVLSMYGAQQISREELPWLHDIVERLARAANIPKPKVYIIATESANAFATGRNPHNAAVAVTTGLLRILNQDEICGVLAHELAHIKNRDILISTIAATLVGAITYLFHFMPFFAHSDDDKSPNPLAFLAIPVALILSQLIRLAISRTREYHADYTGAKFSQQPLSLASALFKLERAAQVAPLDANPGTSHLFIVKPAQIGNIILNLFSTHPPIKERIKRLQAMT